MRKNSQVVLGSCSCSFFSTAVDSKQFETFTVNDVWPDLCLLMLGCGKTLNNKRLLDKFLGEISIEKKFIVWRQNCARARSSQPTSQKFSDRRCSLFAPTLPGTAPVYMAKWFDFNKNLLSPSSVLQALVYCTFSLEVVAAHLRGMRSTHPTKKDTLMLRENSNSK